MVSPLVNDVIELLIVFMLLLSIVTYVLLFTGTESSTELDTTRWIMKFSEVLEALDSANPDGVQMLLRWNSSEKEVSYVVSKVQNRV